MRKFRLKSNALGYSTFIIGEIYPEDSFGSGSDEPVSYWVKKYPDDWEEVFEEKEVTDQKPTFEQWLDKKIKLLVSLSIETDKIVEIKRVYNIYQSEVGND